MGVDAYTKTQSVQWLFVLRRFALCCLLMHTISGIAVLAQTPAGLSNLRKVSLPYSDFPVVLGDSASTLFLYGVIGQDTFWESNPFFEIRGDSLWFTPYFNEIHPGKELHVQYRELPFRIRQTFQRLDPALVQAMPSGNYIGFSLADPASQVSNPWSEVSGLQYSGSFSRGISVGNRQSLVLNSGLNLQLNGNIADNILLKAAISDNQIPIQPEGNTQQLQEFDRIFIELSRNRSLLRAGDFELNKPNSYFLHYFKRSQGALAAHEQDLGNGRKLNAEGSFAISKGKFRRQFISPVEGNQGPYRLLGNDGETFIIVLANTEKVYVDGELLKRGLEMDYVIDYNRGELSFTSRRLITKELRIIIEFEYADQQYLRSLYHVQSSVEAERWAMRFAVFSEQDNPNVAGNQLLGDEDKLFLSKLGDRIDQAVVSSIRPLSDAENVSNPIVYEQVDTMLMDGRMFNGILRFRPDGEGERKVATFIDVGEGNGHYIVSANLANGRVFEWIAPDPVTGRPRGRFEPNVRIITPRLQRMAILGGDLKVAKDHQITAEAAISTLDVNRFSNLDTEDDNGTAYFVRYRGAIQGSNSRFSIKPNASYENKGVHFRAINPYRNQEFNRDWNLRPELAPAREHVWSGGFQMDWTANHSLQYEVSGFSQEGQFSGVRHSYRGSSRLGKAQLAVFGSEMVSESALGRSVFSRPRLDLRYTPGKWELGVYGERDRSSQFDGQGKLADGSFAWDIGRVYLKSVSEKRIQAQVSYSARADYFPVNGSFATATTAQELRMEGQLQAGKQSRLNWNLAIRDLSVRESHTSVFTPAQTYLGRVNYQFSALKNAFRLSTSYELGSGQEPRLQFIYLEVRPGEGQYIWADRNGDGVQQLDEFELAPFQDQANFVRVGTLTNEFIRTNNVLFNYQINWDPSSLWRNAGGLRKALSRFSWQSNINTLRRTLQDSGIPFWNPILTDFSNPAVVNGSWLSRQSVFFNRANPKYELQYHYIRQGNRVFLTTGFERRGNREDQLVLRVNPSRTWSLISTAMLFGRESEAEAFTTRNFTLAGWECKQDLSVQLQQGWRFSGKWRWNDVRNTLGESGENARFGEIGAQAVMNRSGKYALRGELSYIGVRFEGEANSAVAFAMLEGLQNGSNWLWNLNFERTMINNVQLLVGYEGRKTGASSVVHVGRMQLKATF